MDRRVEVDTMGRISREVMFMGMARLASQRATCHRLNVGAIVTRENNPISVGWNGAEAGAPHCAGNDCPGIVPGNCGTLHAEANAIKKADLIMGVNGSGRSPQVDLYTTDSPCPTCCALILNSRLYIRRIFYEKPYRVIDHLNMFRDLYVDPEYPNDRRDRKTDVYLVTPAGYIVNHFTREVVELP
jgi:dCMP deaminase